MEKKSNPYSQKQGSQTLIQESLDDEGGGFSSQSSLPENDNYIFPNCTNTEIDEIRSILSAEKRLRRDIAFLYRKLKDIPFFKALIDKLRLEDDQEALLCLFKLIKLEEYPQGCIIYERGDHINCKAYTLFEGLAYKVDTSSHENKHFTQETNKQGSQVTNLGSKTEIDELLPADTVLLGREHSQVTAKEMGSPRKTKQSELKAIVARKTDTVNIPKHLNSLGKEKRLQSFSLQTALDKDHQTFVKNVETLLKKGLSPTKGQFGEKEDALKNIRPGGHFGQKGLWSMQKRDHTVITKTRCEMIVITSDMIKAVRKILEANKTKLYEFVVSCFPLLDPNLDSTLLKYILNIFTCKTYTHSQCVTIEGQSNEFFYILFQGECEILKKVTLDDPSMSNSYDMKSFFALSPSASENMNILTLNEGSFFGDEILFTKECKYYYTVKVMSPEAKVLAFSKSKFLYKFPKPLLDQIEEYFAQRQLKNCDILTQNLLLRGYSLDKKAFIEKSRVNLEPLKEPKFRTFYSHSTKSRENLVMSHSNSKKSLENIREMINTQYAHKLRLNGMTPVNKTPRVLTESSQEKMNGSSFYENLEDEIKIPDNVSPRGEALESPKYNSNGNSSSIMSYRKSCKTLNKSRDCYNKTEGNSFANQFYFPSERSKKLNPLVQTLKEELEQKEIKPFLKQGSNPEEVGPVKLKFLRGIEPKKGLLKLIKLRFHGPKQNSDSLFNSLSPKFNYADFAKTRYNMKFIEQNDTFDYEDMNIVGVNQKGNADKSNEKPEKPVELHPPFFSPKKLNGVIPKRNAEKSVEKQETSGDFSNPLFNPRKTASRAEFINIHIKHEKKKLNPLQRSKNRTDLYSKSEF